MVALEFLAHVLSIFYKFLASVLILMSVCFEVSLVYGRLALSLNEEVLCHRDVVFFKDIIDLSTVPEHFLSFKIIDLNWLIGVDIFKTFFHWKARGIKAD